METDASLSTSAIWIPTNGGALQMYELVKFADCDIKDVFFDSLREDYKEFDQWFAKKCEQGAEAYVSESQGRIQAFVYLKEENEAVGDLPAEHRMKIGTLKICSEFGRQRLGEGGIGIALWEWQHSDCDQVYLTIYPKHQDLIDLITRFGFVEKSRKGEELVYVKDKNELTFEESGPVGYKGFPYIDPRFKRGVCIPIYPEYHDRMFQRSKLKGAIQAGPASPVSNGITKVYIATPNGNLAYRPGDIAFIYRIAETNRRFKSAITSYCTVSSVTWIKKNGVLCTGMTKESFKKMAGNKTVYSDDELDKSFAKQNVCIITLVYNGFFGEGHNVNYDWLKNEGLFESHPYCIEFSTDEVKAIMKKGGADERFVAFD